MSDLLEQATRALRETSAEPQPKSGLTRARVLDGAEKRYAGRRVSVLRWVVTVAAALAASTALARVAQYWPEIKRAIAPESAEHSQAAPRHPKRSGPRPAQPTAAEPTPQPAVVESPVAPMPAPATKPPAEASAPNVRAPRPSESVRPGHATRGLGTARRTARAPSPAPKPLTSIPATEVAPEPEKVAAPAPAGESAELSLFRRAQRLHLDHDPRALAAWDDYLRIAGRGVLVPEARYNRALSLIRLGRKSEARSALAAFANGEYGNYRKSEARALIDAIDRERNASK
jgi:cytoskeletal protein RodZ